MSGDRDFLSVYNKAAAVDRIIAENCFCNLSPASADQPGEADNLIGMHTQIDIAEAKTGKLCCSKALDARLQIGSIINVFNFPP